MNKEEEKYEFGWLDDPSAITSIIIGLIAITIILSQSFAVNNATTTFQMIRNVVNHNSIYLMCLAYFVILKTGFGKKYFNYLNLFIIILYFITSITSLLTIFQSFSLTAIVSLLLNLSIFTYTFHTFLKDTRIWKEFGLKKSPFNEITNEMYFYIVTVLAVISLFVNLIFTTSFGGTILTMLDALYIIMFARYIYLFGVYLDSKDNKIGVDLKELKEKIEDVFSKVKVEAEKIEADKKTTTTKKSTAKKTTTKKSTAKKTTTKKTTTKKPATKKTTSKNRGDK